MGGWNSAMGALVSAKSRDKLSRSKFPEGEWFLTGREFFLVALSR